MNAVTGGFVGALVTGLAVFGWQARPGVSPEAALPAAQAAPSALHLVSDTQAFGPTASQGFVPAGAAGAPVSLRCEPGQRAVLQQVATPAGSVGTEAGCVTEAGRYIAMGTPAAGVIDPGLVQPARYVTAEPVAPQRVVYRERPARRVSSQRSWQKRALVIGGSAGAGAGIGAIAGGKKGALLGAAIGGGAGTVYELLKHK